MTPKTKKNRKQFFSLIFVPDQDKDPRSISMSYAQGHWLIVLAVLLTAHTIFGTIGYYRIWRLERSSREMRTENQKLRAQNLQIERIIKEFNTYRSVQEKIRMMHGIPLGMEGSGIDWENLELPAGINSPVSALGTVPSGMPVQQVQRNIAVLTEGGDSFYNPAHVPTGLPLLEGHITSHFQRGGWYVGRSHLGIDIAGKMGSLIKAAGSGTVIMAAWTPDFGNVVVISHGKDLYTYYAHALRLLVSQGDYVRKGQGIALLGSSGISSAPHLHFEIWKDGKALDPEQYIVGLVRNPDEE